MQGLSPQCPARAFHGYRRECIRQQPSMAVGSRPPKGGKVARHPCQHLTTLPDASSSSDDEQNDFDDKGLDECIGDEAFKRRLDSLTEAEKMRALFYFIRNELPNHRSVLHPFAPSPGAGNAWLANAPMLEPFNSRPPPSTPSLLPVPCTLDPLLGGH
jgi:hypothetical protein